MSATFPTVESMAAAIEQHFQNADMPEVIECSAVSGGYQFTEAQGVPHSVREPEGCQGDDELFYWEYTNTWLGDPLQIDGYTLTAMHASQYPSSGFIERNLDDIDAGPIVLGCVVVSFSGEDEAEWAWVRRG